MKIAIHQPNYLPWPGFFHKMVNADIFVLLDTVQFTKNSWINRVKIKDELGRAIWISVPVKEKDVKQLINEKMINDANWAKMHIKIIEQNYRKTMYFNSYFPQIKNILIKKWDKISDLNITLINEINKILDINTKLIKSSDLMTSGSSTDLLINIIEQLNGDVYLSGIGGKNYQDEKKFLQNHIELKYQNFIIPNYQQAHGNFISGLSIIDMLFNIGKENTKNIISNEDFD